MAQIESGRKYFIKIIIAVTLFQRFGDYTIRILLQHIFRKCDKHLLDKIQNDSFDFDNPDFI